MRSKSVNLQSGSNFSVLFDQHFSKLYNYSLKLTKEHTLSCDLVQETFLKLWENIDTIKNNNRSIESFLIVTLKNKIFDHFRKENTKRKHINLYALNKEVEERIENEWELINVIDKIYKTMPAKTEEIFKLSRDKGHTYQEIASIKKVSIKTVELHISNALKIFRENLKEYI